MTTIPRSEHPRPDRRRDDWYNLNGVWDFEIDNNRTGLFRRFQDRPALDGKITVPFSPESVLSGVGNTDFMNAVWYRRALDIPAAWQGKRILLHIDACDYATTVFVNGQEVGRHRGGYTPFCFDITDALSTDGNYLTVYAEDDLRSETQASGKQSRDLLSAGCYYTRTTGIWQTVWLEAVSPAHVKSYKVFANVSAPAVTLAVQVSDAAVGGTLRVNASYEGKPMGEAQAVITSQAVTVTVPLAEQHLWEVGHGRLYDLVFTVKQGGETDTLFGYCGLREVALTREKGLQINGKTVFGRFVLDQGFYPDGIITAPDDSALVFDIEAAMACGFNGARLHQKVFEPRFLYHADRLGYMVWDELGNWGLDTTRGENIYNLLPEWLEEVERDFSHPSVIGWCPTNETWDQHGRQQCNALLDTVYDVTKAIDKTRPVITSSGSFPTERTDVHDVHDYEQDPATFRSYYADIDKGIVNDHLMRAFPTRQISKTHLPIFVSEYGGIKWATTQDADAWGYGVSVTDEAAFLARLEGLTDALLENKDIFAFCYTQLTDVEQEQNGVLTYTRQFKFPAATYAAIFGKTAAIEKL
ncbi:MAG: beta-galactosidase [Clostridia bacterium]|nr:beta-galactosidase [Clostridia bacterium]